MILGLAATASFAGTALTGAIATTAPFPGGQEKTCLEMGVAGETDARLAFGRSVRLVRLLVVVNHRALPSSPMVGRVSGSVRNKLFGGFARFQPPLGRAEARMAEAFFFGVSAKRLAQRFVSGAWPCRMY